MSVRENSSHKAMVAKLGEIGVVTDETGTVVYSAAHDPYGGIQQTWVNTYDPTPKFSGKERDSESGLDYFGARYYDRAQYGFASVDSKLSVCSALANPQRWNLYSYCLGNPVNYFDPDGAQAKKVIINITFTLERISSSSTCTRGWLFLGDQLLGYTLELPDKDNIPFESRVNPDTYLLSYWPYKGKQTVPKLEDKNGREIVLIHWFPWIFDSAGTKKLTDGCIGLESGVSTTTGKLTGEGAVDDLVRLMKRFEAAGDFPGAFGMVFGWWFDCDVVFWLEIKNSIPDGKVDYEYEVTGIIMSTNEHY